MKVRIRYWTIECSPGTVPQDVSTFHALIRKCPCQLYSHKHDGKPQHIHALIRMSSAYSADLLADLTGVEVSRFRPVKSPFAYYICLKKEEKRNGAYNPTRFRSRNCQL